MASEEIPRLRVCAMASLAFFVAVTSSTAAQVPSKPVVAYLAGGLAEPIGTLDDTFISGWVVSGGAALHLDVKVPIGLRLDLGYAQFKVAREKNVDLSTNTLTKVADGYTSIGNLSLGGVYDFGGKGHIGGYVAGGIGGYSRYQTVTKKVEHFPGFCDPLVEICRTTISLGTESDRLTKVGYDFSVAVTFPLHSGGQIYIEGRYHWMNAGPATKYLPVSFGYRWS